MSIFIVAEIGINHNGDMSICKELIDVATSSGCDAVKFQKRDIDQVYTQDFLNSYVYKMKFQLMTHSSEVSATLKVSFLSYLKYFYNM